MLAYVWPRLDEAVTRSLGHLTKVPFSCHAASGRVAVAMGTDRRSIFGFSPAKQAPAIDAWDQAKMDAALAHFHVDAVAPSSASAPVGGSKRKRSGLATCEEPQGTTASKSRRGDRHAAMGGRAQAAAATA